MKRNKTNNRRVVITGLGVVSSLGIGWQEFWKNLIAGKSGISRISTFDTSDYECHFAGEIKHFTSAKFLNMDRKVPLGRTSRFVLTASQLAIKDAGVDIKKVKKNMGVSVGTTMGEPQIMEDIDKQIVKMKGPLKYSFYPAVSYPTNSIANSVAKYFHLSKQNIVYGTACAASNYAIAYAYNLIKEGRSQFMLAGGADALSRVAFTGFGRLFAMAPEKCQPFDKNRKGILVGEGSGIVVLESLESALRRKAKIYAEILGYGVSSDARHMTTPSVGGIVKAVTKALKNSGVKPKEIDYISAHGTGTKENDKAESQAMHAVFNSLAERIPISSIKSMLGHTMGAAAALETIACCLVIHEGEIPPTINFKNADPDCRINCVPNKSIKKQVHVAVNNSQAFGGNNACLILKERT